MKRSIVAAALILTGCGASPDASICTRIVDPPSAQSTADSLEFQDSPDWQKQRADACVHRQAYRLARSSDPAETVAKAVVEYCEAPVSGSAAINANHEATEGYIVDDQKQQRMTEIIANYEKFALLKVVEGRAGNCKA